MRTSITLASDDVIYYCSAFRTKVLHFYTLPFVDELKGARDTTFSVTSTKYIRARNTQYLPKHHLQYCSEVAEFDTNQNCLASRPV